MRIIIGVSIYVVLFLIWVLWGYTCGRFQRKRRWESLFIQGLASALVLVIIALVSDHFGFYPRADFASLVTTIVVWTTWGISAAIGRHRQNRTNIMADADPN